MRRISLFIPLIAITALACDAPSATGVAGEPIASTNQSRNTLLASATGGGHYLLSGALDVKFAFSALQKDDGKAMGNFHQRLEADGELIDFSASVTCVTSDPATSRAWIGGIVTENRSTDPAFRQAIHQPGRDVWFRVVDYGEGGDSPADRTTFLGFEGAAGIITSAEYCRARLWPAGDARTWPVTAGNIQVR